MTILDWFDIDNIEHLKAYKHLRATGCWPKDFLPKDITTFESMWISRLSDRLADRYVEEKLSGDVMKLKRMTVEGLQTDGSHHKQWYLEQILISLDVDLDRLRRDLKSKGYEWEPGIAP